jgi:hypothetical protein
MPTGADNHRFHARLLFGYPSWRSSARRSSRSGGVCELIGSGADVPGRRGPVGCTVRGDEVSRHHRPRVQRPRRRHAPAGRARRADVAPAVMPDQRLRAPWRLRYVQGERKPEGCLFCLAAQPGDDVARHVLHRSERCFVMLNAFPYNSGHLMVSPRRHAGSIEDPRRGRAAGADDPHPAGTGARCARPTAPTDSTWASTRARSRCRVRRPRPPARRPALGGGQQLHGRDR